MRLIDADELRIIPYSAFDVMPVCDISSAPTVEAIPIEWLRKYVDEHDEIVEEGLYWIVEEIIDDWKKENETNGRR